MKQEQFEQVVDTQLQRIRDILVIKAKEYATEDRLHNFRTAATLRECTMEQALGGMLSKHTVSIYDMIESGKEYPIAQWDEKITDHLNYLVILRAIIEEREGERLSKMKQQDVLNAKKLVIHRPPGMSAISIEVPDEDMVTEEEYNQSREEYRYRPYNPRRRTQDPNEIVQDIQRAVNNFANSLASIGRKNER